MFGRYNGQGVRRYANGAAYNGSWKDGLRWATIYYWVLLELEPMGSYAVT